MLKFEGALNLIDGAIKWLGVTWLLGFILSTALIAFRAPREPVPDFGEIYGIFIRGYATVYVTKSVNQLMIAWFLLLIGLLLLALVRSVLRGFVSGKQF